MKTLFIGGTGNISALVTQMALAKGFEVYHLNRGTKPAPQGVKTLVGDINNTHQMQHLLANHHWDVVVDWIAFTPQDIERNFQLFAGKTKQFIFISTASAYQKPPLNVIITESTPLKNPFWDYSRQKIACEDLLVKLYREHNFPITIVRPSHTYHTVIPLPLASWTEYTMVDRMKRGLPVVVPGDGNTLWTITHASDFAKGFTGLMGNSHAIGDVFQITSDEAMTWNYIYRCVGMAVGVEPRLVHIASEAIVRYAEANNGPDVSGTLLGDKSFTAIFDNRKIKTLVPEFICTTPFASGIKETIQWFEADMNRKVIKESNNQFLDGLIERYGT